MMCCVVSGTRIGLFHSARKAGPGEVLWVRASHLTPRGSVQGRRSPGAPGGVSALAKAPSSVHLPAAGEERTTGGVDRGDVTERDGQTTEKRPQETNAYLKRPGARALHTH